MTHQEWYARDLAQTNERNRLGARLMSWREYDKLLPYRLKCRGTLRMTHVTEPHEPHAYVECDGCDFELAVPRASLDPEYRGRQLLKVSGLPGAFVSKPFDRNDDNAEAMLAVESWLSDMTHHKPPALHGAAGVGKTHLLTRTGVRLCRQGVRVIYRDFVGLMHAEREFIDRPTGIRPLELCEQAEILILDDLGAERSTPWTQEQLQWLVDQRYKAERPILVATNSDVSDWPSRFGERTASRLAAMTEPTFQGGRDMRLEGPLVTA